MACSCNQARIASLGDSSEPQRYPQFPATDFDPMGAYEPPVRMDSMARKFFGYGADGAPIYVENVSAKATKFIGYEKDGSPVFVENLSAKAYVGNMKDGSPVFINASDPYAINYGNVVATAILAGSAVALGWLVAKATLSYLK